MEKLKTGYHGIPLKDADITSLFQYMEKNYMSIATLSKKMKLSYNQVYFPLREKGRCSRESYLKIQKFLKKIERQDG